MDKKTSKFPNDLISIGITTYNNSENISNLLDCTFDLLDFCSQVIVFDDKSTDNTVEIIKSHKIYRRASFKLDVASENSGGPLQGRLAISKAITSEYVTFIDGDDELDPAAFENIVRKIPRNAEMILSPYKLYGKDVFPPADEGELPINNATVTLASSGIGGRIYSTSSFIKNCPNYYVPRAEDAHVNMRILLNREENKNIYLIKEKPFYIIHAGTKSRSARRIVRHEMEERRRLYDAVRERYNLGNEYLLRSKAFLLSIVSRDKTISHQERLSIRRDIEDVLTPPLRRMVLVCNDPSVLGGVASRVNLAMELAEKRGIEYITVSRGNANGISDKRYYSCDDPDRLREEISNWDPVETSIVVQAAVLRSFPKEFHDALIKFPIVYYGDAQLAAVMQTRVFFEERDFFSNFRASSLLSLSKADISFQKQLGVYGQEATILPVEQRSENTFDWKRGSVIGYVGVSDFRFKATDRLIDVAVAAKRAGLPPIKIFTSTGANSPDTSKLLKMISEAGIESHCEVILDVSDKDRLFGELTFLIVPSKNEAGGTVILEALSFGIPVIGCSYAPAVDEAIRDGQNGYVFNDFDADEIVDRVADTSKRALRRMSQAAFEAHKLYSPERHLGELEAAAHRAVKSFVGRNELRVYPALESVPRIAPVPPRNPAISPAQSAAPKPKPIVADKSGSSLPNMEGFSRRHYASKLEHVSSLTNEIEYLADILNENRRKIQKR